MLKIGLWKGTPGEGYLELFSLLLYDVAAENHENSLSVKYVISAHLKTCKHIFLSVKHFPNKIQVCHSTFLHFDMHIFFNSGVLL